MNALLDTHTILYMATAPHRLGPRARDIVESPHNTLFASLASLWEMAIKVRLGKLVLPLELERFWIETLQRAQLREMPVARTAILRTLDFDLSHRDSFDRFLSAQTLESRSASMSAAAAVDLWGVQRIW